MANIKRNIRFYQPNDPYYWEVDNLPLTDLLSNDLILEDRLKSLEDTFSGNNDGDGGLGGGTDGGTDGGADTTLSGSISVGAISDIKAFSEPITGNPSRFGRIYVNPGKFTARVQVPATRENGAGMMRDHCTYFNNEDIFGAGGLASTADNAMDFVRETRGLARTAVVEFLGTENGSARGIDIPSFDQSDFNGSDPTLERLDLIYIKGTKPIDCQGDATTTPSNYNQAALPQASLGIIKGAYFRTAPVGGLHSNGPRFTDGVVRRHGRTIGMANAELPTDTLLPKFGTVPMPDDLVNFAWHRNYDTQTQALDPQGLTTKQIENEAAFCIPVAYVRVPRSYSEGDPIDRLHVVDIRPFFRSTELDYNERAAVAAAVAPNGHNYFITKFHLQNDYTNPLDSRLTVVEQGLEGLTSVVEMNSSRIDRTVLAISGLNSAVSGLGASALDVLGPHEFRIRNLEASVGSLGGPLGITIESEHTEFMSEQAVFENQAGYSYIGSQGSPAHHFLTSFIPANHRDKLVDVTLTFSVRQSYADISTPYYGYVKGGNVDFMRTIRSGTGSGNSNKVHGAPTINTVRCPATLTFDTNQQPLVSVFTYFDNGSTLFVHSMFISGYTWKDTVSF